jgi:hypothetical protein
LQEILQRAQFQKKKSVFDETVPDFDCSGGLRLSDASDSDGEEIGPSTSQNSKKATSMLNSINATSGTFLDLKSVYENYQRIENDKAKLMSCKQSENDSQKENLNIADLLAMGEGTSSEPTTSKKSSQKRKIQKEDDSDSDDWEEVEGKRVKRPRYMKILKKFEFDG